jgi:hypothetical protein
MVTKFVVVYDSACGGCSDLATRLSTVLGSRTVIRSCRDPHLPVEFPVLARAECRRPFTITVRDDGTMRVDSGVGMVLRAARLVKPGRWLAACGVAWSFVVLRLRR